MNSVNNQDVQANHQIVSLLERAKNNAESIIDRLPDVFAVIQPDGRLLKGNHTLASYLGVSTEEVLSKNFNELFLTETWGIFQSHVARLDSELNKVEFELSVNAKASDERNFSWSVTYLSDSSSDVKHDYVCVVGRDITELRAYEKQLTEIFSSIPLGIITIQKGGIIGPTYSAYALWLLGVKSLAGVHARDAIFTPGFKAMSPAEKEGAENALKFYDMDLVSYDMIKQSFPSQVQFPLTENGSDGVRYIGIKYHPITYQQNIKSLMVILEDRTLLMKLYDYENKKKALEDKELNRILEIKMADPELLSISMDEMAGLFQQALESLNNKDGRSFVNHLHGIKGNSRVLGFAKIRDSSHELESELLPLLAASKPVNWEGVTTSFQVIQSEWKEYESIHNALTSKDKKGIESYFRPVSEMEMILTKRALETSAALGKQVEVHFDWSQIYVRATHFDKVLTCMTHLINNSVDHGIEMPDVRLKSGKVPSGSLKILARHIWDKIMFEVSDDGRGIDVSKVKQVALSKNLVSQDEVNQMTDENAMQLIFRSGLSTAEKVSQISGRGVGLDAVYEMIKDMGGTISVAPRKPSGTYFLFNINIRN